jgi:hypothetical protein
VSYKLNLRWLAILGIGVVVAWPIGALAEDNYEIQVYSSEMDTPGTTMLELHSNFTVEGGKTPREGVGSHAPLSLIKTSRTRRISNLQQARFKRAAIASSHVLVAYIEGPG